MADFTFTVYSDDTVEVTETGGCLLMRFRRHGSNDLTERSDVLFNCTGAVKDALKALVRGWDIEDEAEAIVDGSGSADYSERHVR